MLGVYVIAGRNTLCQILFCALKLLTELLPVAGLERNLLPAANEMQPAYHEPVHVVASGMAIPHPDKVKESGIKGVNHKGFGFGGEDAYFYTQGRYVYC
jgi:hypothetical protein